MIKITALLLAVLLAVGITPMLSVTHAQNATTTTNTTTTETNATIPLEPTQLPVFPEGELTPPESGNQTTSNQTEQGIVSKDNATKVIGLLDDAQVKIDEARDLIRGLQEQIEAGKDQPAASTNDTEEIIESTNESAEDIIDIIIDEVTNDTEVVDNIENATEDVVDAINGSINDASNATIDVIDNSTDTIIDLIDNATENLDNSSAEVAIDNAMIRLLSNLVAAQDYNGGLSEEERDELKANLQDTIVELAGDASDALQQ